MGLLEPATKRTAFAKVGILGFEGSGKTRTAVEIAIGLWRLSGGQGPVAFIDTEQGSDWLLDRFESEGIEVLRVQSRSFKDLVEATSEAVGSCTVQIVDSISHVWLDLMESYKRKKQISDLAFHHWGEVKSEWRTWTDLFINSKIHTIVCGRAAWDYEDHWNDQGRREIERVGTKMRAEGEFSFEPSLLIEMERVKLLEGHAKQAAKDVVGFVNRATVRKDRSDTIMGRSFDFPTFESFAEHFACLNIGGEHLGVDASRTSDDMFDSPEYSRLETKRRRAVCLEEMEVELRKRGYYPAASSGQKAADTNKLRMELLEAIFGTASKTAIETMPLENLEDGFRQMKDRWAASDYGQEEPPEGEEF